MGKHTIAVLTLLTLAGCAGREGARGTTHGSTGSLDASADSTRGDPADGREACPSDAECRQGAGVSARGLATSGAVCAVYQGGRVACWGSNTHGQAGAGRVSEREPPRWVPGVEEAVAVVTGAWHVCALRGEGTVQCWGANDHGQLGDGTTAERPSPVAVTGLTDAVALTAGGDQTCALRRGGQVVCWGADARVPFGNAPRTRVTPEAIALGFAALGVSVNEQRGCAWDQGGAIACWGWRTVPGVHGAEGLQLAELPTQEQRLPDLVSVHVGGNLACALLRAGAVRCWGKRGWDRAHPVVDEAPQEVPGVREVSALAVQNNHLTAVLRDGAVLAWGDGDDPALVAGFQRIVEASMPCARDADGAILCVGQSGEPWGMVQDRPDSEETTPREVLAPDSVTPERWRVALADGVGDACANNAGCGWDDPCVPQRCVAAGSTTTARAVEACARALAPPGACACVRQRCVARLRSAPAPEGDCASAECGFDQPTGRCLVGSGQRGNREWANVEGGTCWCDPASHACQGGWFEPVACSRTADCWFSADPVLHPIRRPASVRGAFRLCRDGALPPECIQGVCGFGPRAGC